MAVFKRELILEGPIANFHDYGRKGACVPHGILWGSILSLVGREISRHKTPPKLNHPVDASEIPNNHRLDA